MHNTMKGIIAGTLALAGATFATADVQAMPIQPLSPAASTAPVENVFYYGYRRPFVRFGYGFRPFYGYRRFYGFRRPFVYGYRRPFFGYRRFYS